MVSIAPALLKLLSAEPRPFFPSIATTASFAIKHSARNALVARNFEIINRGEITVQPNARLRFGTGYFGFMKGTEHSLIRNRGRLVIEGNLAVGLGARWDIGANASLQVGTDTYFSPNTLIVSTDAVTIGENCAIGWDVQIIDADFHVHGRYGELTSSDQQSHRDFRSPVSIGDHVWIGSGAKIFKGVTIPNGCIVAGGAVVTKTADLEERCLLAGNPARVVRNNVDWR